MSRGIFLARGLKIGFVRVSLVNECYLNKTSVASYYANSKVCHTNSFSKDIGRNGHLVGRERKSCHTYRS